MGNETPQSGPPLREAAAAIVAPDPTTANLLAKHSAGQPLTQQEYGKLGAFAKKAKNFFTGNRDAPGGPGKSGPAPGNAPALGAVASNQAPDSGVAPVPVDPGIAQRTTSAILRRCDAITVRWIENEARRAGAQGQTLDRFRTAAALAPPDQQLIAELSPDILAEMGIDVRRFPIVTAAAIVGLHGTNLWLLVDELREMRKERDSMTADKLLAEERAAREAKAKAQPVTQPGLLESLATAEVPRRPSQPAPIPAERPRPPGAPPNVTCEKGQP
jgi:hypothetical protein